MPLHPCGDRAARKKRQLTTPFLLPKAGIATVERKVRLRPSYTGN